MSLPFEKLKDVTQLIRSIAEDHCISCSNVSGVFISEINSELERQLSVSIQEVIKGISPKELKVILNEIKESQNYSDEYFKEQNSRESISSTLNKDPSLLSKTNKETSNNGQAVSPQPTKPLSRPPAKRRQRKKKAK